MTRTATLNAVGYIRCSLDVQATEGVTLEAQREQLTAYAASRGIVLADIVVDAGVSGGKALADREGGKKLLQALKSKKASIVIACKLDRLFRSSVDALQTTQMWDRQGIALHLLDLGGSSLDTSSPIGRMFLTMMASFSEFERGVIGQRTSAALQHKAKQNQRVSRFAPLGYRFAEGGAVVPDEKEQEVIGTIKKMHAEGMNPHRIACKLNEDGIASRGKMWRCKSVQVAIAA